MSFTIFQNEKTPFWAIKTTSSKSRKIDIFPRGLTHAFGPKMAIFPIFFLGNIGQENVFYDILIRKNPFLGYKNKNFNGFGPKMAILATFFCQAIQARRMSFVIFYNEITTFQAIKTTTLKSRKINIFPKGLTHGFCPKMANLRPFFFQAIQGR